MLAFSSGDAARYLLAFFLLAVGLTLGWALVKLAAVFGRLASLIRGAENEILPVPIRDDEGHAPYELISSDEGIRPERTVETLAKLKPAFPPEDGQLKAGH